MVTAFTFFVRSSLYMVYRLSGNYRRRILLNSTEIPIAAAPIAQYPIPYTTNAPCPISKDSQQPSMNRIPVMSGHTHSFFGFLPANTPLMMLKRGLITKNRIKHTAIELHPIC